MPPDEVMDRFSEEQMAHLVAYQNLYGPITPRRLDILAARIGMDAVSPHMKKGVLPRMRDHLMVWSHADRPRRTGREILGIVQGIQQEYDRDDETARTRRARRRKRGA